MGKVIRFNEHKKEIEDLAEQKGFIKISEDRYKIVLTSFYSKSTVLEDYLYNKFGNEKDSIFEKELVERIESIVVADDQKVEVSLVKVDGDLITFKVDCINTDKSITVGIQMVYSPQTIDAFIALVANSITKKNVEVSMSTYVNWNDVVKYVRKEKK